MIIGRGRRREKKIRENSTEKKKYGKKSTKKKYE